jgi:DNA-binding response OmpR family regulator
MSLLPIQRALVMEADSSTRLFITESLKTFGITDVEDYASEYLALRRFIRGGFDLAIFDLRVWSSPVAAGGPTLVVATSPVCVPDDPGVVLRTQRQGADTLLEKPFNKWLLFGRLEALLAAPTGRRLKIVELPTNRFRLGTVR